jgi:hypothetical protein
VPLTSEGSFAVERLLNLPSRPDERPLTGNRNTELIADLGGSLSLSIVPHRFYMHGQSRRGDKHLYALRTRFNPNGFVNAFEVGVLAAYSAERRFDGQ